MGFSVETSVPVFSLYCFPARAFEFFLSLACCPCCPCTSAICPAAAAPWTKRARCITSGARCFANTLFFVLGISFAFFLLGFGFTAAGQFFRENRMILGRVGGIIVILFGLYQLGLFGSSKLLTGKPGFPSVWTRWR